MLLLLLLLLPMILLLPLAFDFRVPFRSDGAGGKNPKGGVQGRTPFFDETGMSRRKIPPAEWTRPAQRAGRGGRGVFLLVTSLCTSKEK
ncbi:hypothetical protein [Stenotrophomonas acidaminiphila]